MNVNQTSGLTNLVLLMCMVMGSCDLASPSQSQKGHTNASTLPQSTTAQDPQSKETAGQVIWSGDSGGVRIVWTTSDLYKQSTSETEGLLAPLVRKGFDDFVAVVMGSQPDKQNSERCSYERRFEVLSVVGTLVSFEDQYQDDCGGAHPSAETRFTATDLSKPGEVRYARQDDTPMMNVDLANPGRISKLTDYFNEQDILQALLREPSIQSAVAKVDGKKQPQSLAALPQLFADNSYALGDLDFELRPDFLTRFAFHHVEGNRVAVRIGLPAQSGASRNRHKELEIFLQIPESLTEQFKLAASRRQGFLMSDAAQIGGDRSTNFRLKTGETGGH